MKTVKSSSTLFCFNLARSKVPIVLGLALLSAWEGRAALRTWDGSSSGNWSTAANWVENAVPADGDDLVFPVANIAGIRRATNNIIGLDLRSITFYGSNYWVYGGRVSLTEGLTAYNRTGENLIAFPITLEAPQAIRVTTTLSGSMSVSTNVNLNGYDLTVDSGVGELYLNGILSGTGDLRKEGSGDVWLGGPGPNTYVGSMFVAAGTLYLNKLTGPGITGAITNSGTILYYRHSQMLYQRVMLNAGSVLDLGNYDDIIGPLLLRGGTARTLTGTLTLGGNITNYASSTVSIIQGTLSLGSGNRIFHVDNGSAFPDLEIQANIIGGSVGFTKAGDGSLRLSGTNTYNGRTYLADGISYVTTDFPFGDPGAGVIVSNTASLQLIGAQVTYTPLTLNPDVPGAVVLTSSGLSGWAGPITLSNDVAISTGSTLVLSNAIGGPGGITLMGATFEFAGNVTNTYAGLTTVNCDLLLLNHDESGARRYAIPGDLVIGGGTKSSNVVKYLQCCQMPSTADITFHTNGVMNLNGFYEALGGLTFNGGRVDNTGSGYILLNYDVLVQPTNHIARINGLLRLNGTRTFDVGDGTAGSDLVISAQILTGGIVKEGRGILYLAASNSFPGSVTVNEGLLWVANNFGLGNASGDTTVNSGGTLFFSSATDEVAETITLNGDGGPFVGALQVAASLTLLSNLVLQTDSHIYVGSGDHLTHLGVITGSGALTKIGSGTLTLAGSADNTYTGDTTVVAGELVLAKTGGHYGVPHGSLTIGRAPLSTDPAIVRFGGHYQLPSNLPIIVNHSGRLDLNGYNGYLGPLDLYSAVVTNRAPATTYLYGNVSVHQSVTNRGSRLYGTLYLTGTRTFDIANTDIFPDLLCYAQVTGTGGLRKLGTGALSLYESNAYAGSTLIGEGNVYVYDSWALGQTNGGTVVSNGANLVLSGYRDVIGEPLTLSGAGILNLGALASIYGSNYWGGNITIEGDTRITVDPGGYLYLNGAIGGTGELSLDCAGVIRFAGSQANTYAGTTRLQRGLLQLAKTISNGAIPGPLIVGSGAYAATNLHLGHNQIANAAAVTVEAGSLLDLNDYSDTIGPLTLDAARVETGTGTLRLNGDVAVSNTDDDTVMRGVVDLWGSVRSFDVATGVLFNNYASIIGTGQLVKEGRGWMILRGSNDYAGLTLVRDGILDTSHAFALGQTNNGTVVSNGATLYLSRSITNESLTLNGPGIGYSSLQCDVGTNTWAGPITLNADSTISVPNTSRLLNLIGPIQGPGGLTKYGDGPARFGGASANTYAGMTRVKEGTLQLDKSVTDGAISGALWIGDGAGTDEVLLLAANQIANTAQITITNSGLLDLEDWNDAVGSVRGSGQIDLGSARLTTGDNDETTLFTGLISGTGGRLSKSGSGTFTITGNNSYSGVTIVAEGTLLVGGSQPASAVQVNVMGTLQSTGTVGNVTNYGILAPGASPGGMFSSNLVIMSGAGVLAVEIEGATSDRYDRVNARGVVDVSGGKLWLDVGYPPSEGDEFLIVNNLGGSPVVGTFTGLPEGALVTTNSLAFRISYTGGDGNDIVLSFTNNTLRFLYATVRGGNGNNLIDPNECNLLWLTLSNASLTPIQTISAVLTPVTPGVMVTYGASGYPSVAAGVAVANNEPFQISTLPGFLCGTNVEFLLAVQTATHGSFSFPVTLPSGSVGSAFTYSDANPKGIPDGGSITSSVNVASFSGPLVKATVDLFISHSYDADLEIYLQAPDGTLVELSTDNGSTGNSYGVSCEAAGFKRTQFDDDAARAITSGTAPFTNSYRPESPLAVLRGKSGAEVSGSWKLIVRDDLVNAFTGALNCWSLTLYGASCTDGGGPCESCPDRTLYGTLSPLSSGHVNYLLRNGVASDCGRAKLCSGLALGNTRRYQAFTFVNGESNACITVALTADQPLFSAAYSETFNPHSLCANYLADLGAAVSEGVIGSYSFRVAAGSRFVVIVEETVPGSGGNFALSVTGGSCRPTLQIRPEGTNQVVLDWTTAAIGYQLEWTNALSTVPSSTWPLVPGNPLVFDSRFQVTNQVTPANRFYRLQKP